MSLQCRLPSFCHMHFCRHPLLSDKQKQLLFLCNKGLTIPLMAMLDGA